MHGLMSLWFAPLIELEADLGYFYLCPACHDELIVPELERIQNRILELHPAAQRSLDHEMDAPEPDEPDEDGADEAGSPAGPAAPELADGEAPGGRDAG